MNLQNITLVSFGNFDTDFLKTIAKAVNQEYLVSVDLKEGHIDISEFYDPTRRQYNGGKLLKEIEQSYASDSVKTLGLFTVDLFIPILTYIFGQAFLNGRSGLASFYRLGNEKYGIQNNDRILFDRFSKEIIHELGHTYGLIHCHNPSCVMRSSTYAEDIDQKDMKLCSSCRKLLA